MSQTKLLCFTFYQSCALERHHHLNRSSVWSELLYSVAIMQFESLCIIRTEVVASMLFPNIPDRTYTKNIRSYTTYSKRILRGFYTAEIPLNATALIRLRSSPESIFNTYIYRSGECHKRIYPYKYRSKQHVIYGFIRINSYMTLSRAVYIRIYTTYERLLYV